MNISASAGSMRANMRANLNSFSQSNIPNLGPTFIFERRCGWVHCYRHGIWESIMVSGVHEVSWASGFQIERPHCAGESSSCRTLAHCHNIYLRGNFGHLSEKPHKLLNGLTSLTLVQFQLERVPICNNFQLPYACPTFECEYSAALYRLWNYTPKRYTPKRYADQRG